MVTLRRCTFAALSSLIVAVMAAGPAHAATGTPEVFGGTGTARVLHLSVLGKDLTLGSSDSTVESTLKAHAVHVGTTRHGILRVSAVDF